MDICTCTRLALKQNTSERMDLFYKSINKFRVVRFCLKNLMYTVYETALTTYRNSVHFSYKVTHLDTPKFLKKNFSVYFLLLIPKRKLDFYLEAYFGTYEHAILDARFPLTSTHQDRISSRFCVGYSVLMMHVSGNRASNGMLISPEIRL